MPALPSMRRCTSSSGVRERPAVTAESVSVTRPKFSLCHTAQIPLMRRCDLLPGFEHQDTPKIRGPVPLPALMLSPATAQESAVQHILIAPEQGVVSEFFQLTAEPLGKRHSKPLLNTVQNRVGQYRFECLFENVLAAAAPELQTRGHLGNQFHQFVIQQWTSHFERIGHAG